MPQEPGYNPLAPPTPSNMKKRKAARSKKKPKRPSTSVPTGEDEDSPEAERGESLSQALLQGASVVPDSPIANTLRGALAGAGIGTSIDTSLRRYQDRKRRESLAKAVLAEGPSKAGGTPGTGDM